MDRALRDQHVSLVLRHVFGQRRRCVDEPVTQRTVRTAVFREVRRRVPRRDARARSYPVYSISRVPVPRGAQRG